ncbi:MULTISPECIES: hypothetical protein [Bacillus cereus group]|nr:hypothetical protein [Bacillus mycoides]
MLKKVGIVIFMFMRLIHTVLIGVGTPEVEAQTMNDAKKSM